MKYTLRLIAYTFFFVTHFVHAQTPKSSVIQPEEWPFLPTWCRYTQDAGESISNPSIQAQGLISQLGKEGWSAIHHYCWGLVKVFRSYKIGITEEERHYWLSSAIGEIDYVLRNSPPNFVLRPELLTKRGHILLMLEKYVEAEKDLKAAIKEQTTYWPPYGYLSDVYLKQGKTGEARMTLEKGLKIAPDAKGLKNRMIQLK